MLRKIAKYLLHLALWSAVIAAVVWAGMLSKTHRESSLVRSTDISVEGGESNPLIAAERVDQWLKEQGVHPEGSILSKVDIAAIERIVESHNAVAEANVYVAYDGGVKVNIEQREPMARLICILRRTVTCCLPWGVTRRMLRSLREIINHSSMVAIREMSRAS